MLRLAARPPVRPSVNSLRRGLLQLQERLPQLRRVDATAGASLEVALARVERPESRPAKLVDDARVRAYAVPMDGAASVTAFLDGVQESHCVAWIGTVPIVHGRVAAVIRERIDRRLVTWRDDVRQHSAMYAQWARVSLEHQRIVDSCGFVRREVTMGEDATPDPHPLRAMQDAANAVTQDREAIERDLARDFCTSDAGKLYLDGGLPSHEAVHASAGVVGVVKSHQTLYVSDADLAVVLGLRTAERSSVIALESRRRLPVATWYLRVRDAAGHDPFWGLVRVEVPWSQYESAGRGFADSRSAWVLAERAPVALPDGRWDTMAYGVRNCEAFLRASLAR